MIKSSNSVSGASAGSSSQSDLRRVLLWAALLAAGTVLLYAPALRNGFVNFDDPDYVIRNSHVLQGLTWQNVRWAFGTDNPAANWHPLTWISHMLDVQLYGTNPAGHHFTNISFQAMDVALLFFLLYRATSHLYRSAVVAALFAIHPLNVESVAWAAERKTVLCMLFFLLTIWAYGWYVRKRGVARYLCVLVLFALALMSKLMVLSLPFALLLLDYWPLQRFADALQTGEKPHFLSIFLRLFAEKIPLFLLSISAAVITLRLHRKDGALAGAMPLSWRLPNAVYSYAVYLGKLVWPSRLAVFYPHPENTLASWKVISAALLLAAVSAIVWRFRDKRYLLIGWLWFLGTMVPMIGIVQSGRQGMAGRFMYIPMLGLMLAAVWLVGEWATRVGWQKGIVGLAFALLALPYIVATEKQISYWHDSLSLFSYTLAVTSNNGIAENNFAVALMEQGRADLAQPHFVSAVRLIPELASAHYNLAVTFQLQGQAEEAARQYRLAIACSSDPVEVAQAHNNLGMLYLASKNYVAALLELNAAIAANPNEQNSYIARGQIELDSWNYPAAVADFARAAKIWPSPVACFWLGRALEKQGDSAQAAQAYQYALQLAPGMTEARVRLDALRDNAAAHP